MALSAMVTSSIEQVVLLGDNQSIQPLVHNDSARNLGMLRSLFERYSDKSVSLDTQFRMVSQVNILTYINAILAYINNNCNLCE